MIISRIILIIEMNEKQKQTRMTRIKHEKQNKN